MARYEQQIKAICKITISYFLRQRKKMTTMKIEHGKIKISVRLLHQHIRWTFYKIKHAWISRRNTLIVTGSILIYNKTVQKNNSKVWRRLSCAYAVSISNKKHKNRRKSISHTPHSSVRSKTIKDHSKSCSWSTITHQIVKSITTNNQQKLLDTHHNTIPKSTAIYIH